MSPGQRCSIWEEYEKAMNKKEQILSLLDGASVDYIPVIPLAAPFAIRRSGMNPGLAYSQPELFADALIRSRQDLGYDGLWVGGFGGVVSAMGKNLIDKFGAHSTTGECVIHRPADLDKLNPFDVQRDLKLDGLRKTIQLIRQREPEEPILTVVSNPASSAALLMDVANFYINLIQDPEFVRAVIAAVTGPILDTVRALVDVGVDIIWAPAPVLGGSAISRKHYEQICMESCINFSQKVRQLGARLIIHTCGNWNDRFDLVMEDKAHCLHVSECDLARFCRQYGDQTAVMGQIPSSPIMLMGTPEQVYEAAYADCMTAGGRGRFILSPDCGMPPHVPDENVRAMVRGARDAQKALF